MLVSMVLWVRRFYTGTSLLWSPLQPTDQTSKCAPKTFCTSVNLKNVWLSSHYLKNVVVKKQKTKRFNRPSSVGVACTKIQEHPVSSHLSFISSASYSWLPPILLLKPRQEFLPRAESEFMSSFTATDGRVQTRSCMEQCMRLVVCHSSRLV